jgi:hypothetical protein
MVYTFRDWNDITEQVREFKWMICKFRNRDNTQLDKFG